MTDTIKKIRFCTEAKAKTDKEILSRVVTTKDQMGICHLSVETRRLSVETRHVIDM